ncbi:MAG: ATP-binding cassette domain-containing protein [Tissierellaceae bacterium]|nr:ATP-binding cassette domain-containing protein [Tissierellaceae bacterium]
MEITIENLERYYGDRRVLYIEKMEIEKGKITAITGPNGCGKTTLLNIIAGLDREFSGVIKYDGKYLNRETVDKMTIVFQKPYLFRRTVFENIEYPLRIRGINKVNRKPLVVDLAKGLEIENLMGKKAHLLSGGESQKVALARALVFKPELLLLDEPTSNIDPDAINTLEREILKFNKETECTVLIVTHNMEQAKRLGNRIIELSYN